MIEDTEHPTRAPARLVGREGLVADLSARAVTGVPALTVVAGEAGSGRSTVLDAVGRDLVDQQVRTLHLKVGETDRSTVYGALYRLITALEPEPGTARPPMSSVRETVLGLVAKLGAITPPGVVADDATSARLADAVFSALRRHTPVVVLVDDAQCLDTATAGLIERFTRRCSGSGCSIVATWRLPTSVTADTGHSAAAMRRLISDGMARLARLRPLSRREAATVITHEVGVIPVRDLVDRLHQLSRGSPNALRAAVDGSRAGGVLRLVDRHAYLGVESEPLDLPEGHSLLASVRDSGELRWRVAKAMAVLCPVGASAAGLVGEALDTHGDTVLAELRALVEDRVLVRDSRRGWRFRLPILREVLQSRLGPYERRQLCALGAAALWEGTARTEDGNLLADLLAGAGRLVDQNRSAKELLASGGAVMFTDGMHAARWLRAAVERMVDPAQRANAMVAHAAACGVGNRMGEAIGSARTLLRHYSAELDPDMLQEMEIVYATGLAACEDWDELGRLADGPGSPPTSGTPGHEVITRGFALMLLGRWVEGARLLEERRNTWSSVNPVTADFGHMFLGGAGALLGDLSTLRRFIAEPERWPAGHLPQHSFEHARYEVDMLLMFGELRPALDRLEAYSMSPAQLHGPDRFMIQWLSGEHSAALDTARRSIAEDERSARPLAPVMMSYGAACLLAGKGWLSRARQMAQSGRGPHLNHVLDHVDSGIIRFLGDPQRADELLWGALRQAQEHGYVLGTEKLWHDLASREHQLGHAEQAREYVRKSEQMARELQTGYAELVHLLARADVFDDSNAARAAVKLARERGLPFECAATFWRVGLSGVDTSRLLSEAYEIFGELDALLWRARTREMMRANDVIVPGRNKTTSENERLLAVLVSEGLTNRQLATVFGTSEKSVEGRLTRMFAKIGYRSRVELAAAMVTGEYPG